MKKPCTKAQIYKTNKQHEAVAKLNDICGEMVTLSCTFYNRKSRYTGHKVNEAKRLKELESESIICDIGTVLTNKANPERICRKSERKIR